MQQNRERRSTRTLAIWILFVTAAILAAALAVWTSARKAGRMTAAAASNEQQFAQATPGAKIKLVIEITDSAPAGTIRGKLLQKKTETIYVRTPTQVMVRSSAQTKLVMGQQSDVHPGAVVHVTGTAGKDHNIDAEQIVILTGYVQVQ